MKEKKLMMQESLIRQFVIRIYANPKIFSDAIAKYEELQALLKRKEEVRGVACLDYYCRLREICDDLRYEAERIFDTDAKEGFAHLVSMANGALRFYDLHWQHEAA